MFSIIAGPQLKLPIPPGLCKDGEDCPLLKWDKAVKFGGNDADTPDEFTPLKTGDEVGLPVKPDGLPERHTGFQIIVEPLPELPNFDRVDEMPEVRRTVHEPDKDAKPGQRITLIA